MYSHNSIGQPPSGQTSAGGSLSSAGTPSGGTSTGGTSTGGTSTGGTSTGGTSSSTESMLPSVTESANIEKIITNYKYHKGDIISIGLNVVKCDKCIVIENARITDHIPEVFEFIDAEPNDYYTKNTSLGCKIIWYRDRISSEDHFEYYIRTNECGEYDLGKATLTADIKNNHAQTLGRGRVVNSNEESVSIENRKPEILQPSDSEIHVNSLDSVYIYAIVKDQDNDKITCNLWSNDCTPMEPINETNISSTYKFIWDLSDYFKSDNINSMFNIEANDGVDQVYKEVNVIVDEKPPIPWDIVWDLICALIGGGGLLSILAYVRNRYRNKSKPPKAT